MSSTGHVYALAFTGPHDQYVKVGCTASPGTRLRTLVIEAQRHRYEPTSAWMSRPLEEYRAAERAILDTLRQLPGCQAEGEYLRGVPFTEAAQAARAATGTLHEPSSQDSLLAELRAHRASPTLLLNDTDMEWLESSTYEGSTIRVLLHLCRTARPDLGVARTQQEVALHLGITQASVSRSMARLLADGFLLRTDGRWSLRPGLLLLPR